MMQSVRKYMVSAVFMIMLVFPMVNQFFSFIEKRKTGQAENIAKPLAFDLKRLDYFPEQFDDFFLDRLKVRDKLVLLNSLLHIYVFDLSTLPDKVIIGKDGWLYSAGKMLNTYTNSIPLREGQLDSIKDILDTRYEWAAKKGIRFYVVLIPNKAEIYPEYLPSTIIRASDKSRTDQILDYMKNDTGIVFIDLRKILLLHKEGREVFFKSDNHWSYLGAYYGYSEVMNRIRKDFPSVGAPIALDSFRIDSSKKQAGGEAMLLNMEDWFWDYRINLTPLYKQKAVDGEKKKYPCPEGFEYPWDFEVDREVKNDSLPSAVFIRDSYMDFNLMFFQEHFRRSVYIFDAWKYGSNYYIINSEKPDIVVLSLLDSGYETFIENAYKEGDNK